MSEPTLQQLQERYPCIVRWGYHMGSYDYYIENQLRKALETNAPVDAIYERKGIWRRASEIEDENLRKRIMNE